MTDRLSRDRCLRKHFLHRKIQCIFQIIHRTRALQQLLLCFRQNPLHKNTVAESHGANRIKPSKLWISGQQILQKSRSRTPVPHNVYRIFPNFRPFDRHIKDQPFQKCRNSQNGRHRRDQPCLSFIFRRDRIAFFQT